MKLLEGASYLALCVVCSLGTYRLYQFHPQESVSAAQAPFVASAPASLSGRIPLDFTTRKRWVILALSTQCRFCQQSVPFQQSLLKITKASNAVGLVAIFPQTTKDVDQYEAAYKFFPKTLADLPLNQIEVPGTPTLLIVDGQGKVLRHWEGLLSEKAQKEVITEVTKATKSS
jgi:hypothetical protein